MRNPIEHLSRGPVLLLAATIPLIREYHSNVWGKRRARDLDRTPQVPYSCLGVSANDFLRKYILWSCSARAQSSEAIT